MSGPERDALAEQEALDTVLAEVLNYLTQAERDRVARALAGWRPPTEPTTEPCADFGSHPRGGHAEAERAAAQRPPADAQEGGGENSTPPDEPGAVPDGNTRTPDEWPERQPSTPHRADDVAALAEAAEASVQRLADDLCNRAHFLGQTCQECYALANEVMDTPWYVRTPRESPLLSTPAALASQPAVATDSEPQEDESGD